MRLRITSAILVLFLAASVASGQVVPRTGTHFTFGIPEGPDGLTDPVTGSATSALTLNVIGTQDGRGIITSPSGYCFTFTFTANVVTIINLPYSLMHLNDLGKTNKGLIMKTSQPVNAVFHDFLSDAGEATQIYPDAALDTSYRVTTWGVFDDPGEDNHSEFIVTATADNTDVTIIPSVQALGNHPARIPIHTTLNQGECYIVKADVNSLPVDRSLTGSTVSSTKPVSVISGTTCGYVPLGVESCNEMIDEILPRHDTSSVFYVCPMRDTLVENTVIFTSDVPNFYLKTASGILYSTNTGWLVLQINKPEMLQLTAPCQCFILAEGSWIQEIGDPSICAVLPQSEWVDTMLWYTPDFEGQIGFQNAPFADFVSVIYPTASESQVLLDGVPIASVARPRRIINSQMSAAVPKLVTGVHQLSSPVPIYATVAGFADADGYSFMPGGIGPKLPDDTIPTTIDLSVTPAKTCRTFTATVSSKFTASDNISSCNLTLTYDQTLFTIISATLGPTAQGGQWVTDTRTPGKIFVTASCMTPFTDSGVVLSVQFSASPTVTTSPLIAQLVSLGGSDKYSVLEATSRKDIVIEEVRDTAVATLSISSGTSYFGSLDTATVRLETVPTEPITEIVLHVAYDHDVMSMFRADLGNTLIGQNTTILPTQIDANTDQVLIKLQPAKLFTNSGVLVRLVFRTYVSDSVSTRIDMQSSLLNARPCPLDIVADPVSSEYTGHDSCGFATLRAQMNNQPFAINSIVPNPSTGSFTIDLDRHLFSGPLHVTLVDELGTEVWHTDHISPDINEKILCNAQHLTASGTYFLRVSGSGKTETRKIIIRN